MKLPLLLEFLNKNDYTHANTEINGILIRVRMADDVDYTPLSRLSLLTLLATMASTLVLPSVSRRSARVTG